MAKRRPSRSDVTVGIIADRWSGPMGRDKPDSERFTRMYRDHYDRVLAYALRRAPAEVAKEAVDETFLIAWRKVPDLPARVLPWLLVVARNAINNQFRGRAGSTSAPTSCTCSKQGSTSRRRSPS